VSADTRHAAEDPGSVDTSKYGVGSEIVQKLLREVAGHGNRGIAERDLVRDGCPAATINDLVRNGNLSRSKAKAIWIFCPGVAAAIKAYPEFLGGVMAPLTRQELGDTGRMMITCLNTACSRLVHSGYCCSICEAAAPYATGHDKDCDANQQRLAETRHEATLRVPIAQLRQML
jgi:hypothetical protein